MSLDSVGLGGGSAADADGRLKSGENVGGHAMTGPTPKAWVMRISPYKAGDSATPGVERIIKLSSNENPLGPSPRAVEAYRRAADRLAHYPDGGALRLREAIAGAHRIDPDRIVCGAGSDELISLLCAAFAGPGDEVLHSAFGFAMYRISSLASGAEPIAAPERNLTADPEALLAAVGPRTRIVFLANPNNPTGTYLTGAEIRAFADALPESVLLVLDEAYAEYMRAKDYEPGFSMVENRRNVVVLRTFSKIYGLAHLRLGWLYGPEGVVDALQRVRGPFNVAGAALAAGEAAMRDREYVEACALQNEVWRDWLTKQFREAGVETPDSVGNFVLPRFGESGPTSAAAADAFLRSRGVIARRMESYGLPDRLRITVGASADNVIVAEAVAAFMAGAPTSAAAE